MRFLTFNIGMLRWECSTSMCRWVDGAVPQPRGRKAKHALARREQVKHARYPGLGLIPFVLDTRDRRGMKAQSWLLNATRPLDAQERGEAMGHCRAVVSNALQHGVAEQLLSGYTLRQTTVQGRNVRPRT